MNVPPMPPPAVSPHAEGGVSPPTHAPACSAVRACVLAAVVCGAAIGLVFALGLAPSRMLAAAAAGFAMATVSGSIGVVLKERALVQRGALSAQQFQLALGLDFVLQLFAVAGGMIGLHFFDSKFLPASAFGLAFAATALGFQAIGAVVLTKGLRNGRRRPPAADARSLSKAAEGPLQSPTPRESTR